jgi:hypothetical protein
MKKTLILVLSLAAMLSLTTLASAADLQWSVLVPEATILAATGETGFSAGSLSVNSAA